MPTRALALIIAVAIFILIVVMAKEAVHRYENYLSGLWVGDPAFLKKAQLSDLQLFIAPREKGCRQGYLIMTNEDGEFISNQAIELHELASWGSALRASLRAKKDTYTARRLEVEYDAVKEGDAPPMPEHMKMTMSILDGTLTLYDGKKVYAFMEKSPAASAAAVDAYRAN